MPLNDFVQKQLLRKEKAEIMKELCDRYEQMKFINDQHTEKIIGTYIFELEMKLFELLIKDKKFHVKGIEHE